MTVCSSQSSNLQVPLVFVPVSVLVSRNNSSPPVVESLVLLSHTRAPQNMWLSQNHWVEAACLAIFFLILKIFTSHGSNETTWSNIFSSLFTYSYVFSLVSIFSSYYRGKYGHNNYQLVQTCIVYLCTVHIWCDYYIQQICGHLTSKLVLKYNMLLRTNDLQKCATRDTTDWLG